MLVISLLVILFILYMQRKRFQMNYSKIFVSNTVFIMIFFMGFCVKKTPENH